MAYSTRRGHIYFCVRDCERAAVSFCRVKEKGALWANMSPVPTRTRPCWPAPQTALCFRPSSWSAASSRIVFPLQ